MSRPDDLSFEAAECDVSADGASMRCEFEQVFLTTTTLAPDTCLVTTNHYDRTFARRGAEEWVSDGTPEGPCGTIDRATLTDEGGVRWTLELRKVPARPDDPACRPGEPDVLSWRNIRRPLPCRFVQPGALRR